jgi:Mg-chelatase subunit ChlD
MQCPKCGHELRPGGRFCSHCGAAVEAAGSTHRSQRLSMTPEVAAALEAARRPLKADVVFVIDTTGSMSDKIEGLLKTCLAFAHELASSSIDYRLGLIGFGDLLLKEKMSIYPPTDKAETFQGWIKELPRTGGGDEPESSLDAVREALRLEFRPDAQKVVILITDAPPHDPDTRGYSAEKVTGLLCEAKALAFCITPPLRCWQEMAERTGGEWFEIKSDANFIPIIGRLAKTVSRTVTLRLTGRL